MNDLKEKMINMLIDLKENHSILGLKIEFEQEGASFKEAEILKELAENSNLDFSVKIGGCCAIRDVIDCKKLKINTLIAPMIESEYALEKFYKAIDSVYSKKINLFINIETIEGYNNLDKILNSKYFNSINGIIFGRSDMLKSLNKDISIEDNAILNYTKNIADKLLNKNKKFIVGGNISTDSLTFLKKIPYLTNFETRKIIFDSVSFFKKENQKEGIIKAIEFEKLWIKYKISNNLSTILDNKRLEVLEKRIK